MISRNIPSVFVRPSKITENKIVLEELQNTSWQYFVDSVIIATERKRDLKATKKKETEIVKDLENNYKILRRLYNSTYSNITGQFKL